MYVLANDLSGTVFSADPASLAALRDILVFIHKYAPVESYGRPEKLAIWEQIGVGLNGLTERPQESQEGVAAMNDRPTLEELRERLEGFRQAHRLCDQIRFLAARPRMPPVKQTLHRPA